MTGGVGGMTGGVGGTTGGVGGMTAGVGGMTGGVGGMTGGVGGVGGMTGGGGGMGDGSAVNVEIEGPYAVATYDMTDPEWDSATMYYPMGEAGPFAAMAVSPGYTEYKEDMSWWGEMLASHGFAVLVTTPTDTFGDQPPDRGVDLVQAVMRIKAENAAAGSPLMGKIDVAHVGVSGHSMGGGGSLHAAATLGDQVQAVIPLMEHGPAFDATQAGQVKAAALLIAGEADTAILGPPDLYSIPHYKGMTAASHRAIGIVVGGDHFMAVNTGAHHDVLARYSVAWLKLYLEGDDRYAPYIYGAEHMAAAFSDYCTDNASGPANTAGCQ
jgi:triacylglycerol lipase